MNSKRGKNKTMLKRKWQRKVGRVWERSLYRGILFATCPPFSTPSARRSRGSSSFCLRLYFSHLPSSIYSLEFSQNCLSPLLILNFLLFQPVLSFPFLSCKQSIRVLNFSHYSHSCSHPFLGLSRAFKIFPTPFVSSHFTVFIILEFFISPSSRRSECSEWCVRRDDM